MDYNLVGLNWAHCFLDETIIVSRGTQEDHFNLVYQCLKKLDEDKLRISLSKCHFAKIEIEWLGYKFCQAGIFPIESKTSAILNLLAHKN